MNLYRYIIQSINLEKISSFNGEKYELAIVRDVLKKLSNIFYRDYTFYLDKENLIDRKDIYEKQIDLKNINNFSIVCKTYCNIVRKILKQVYDIDSELISPFDDEFRHIDLLITCKNGKKYIVDPLSDLVEMQVGLKTKNFASKQYYDRNYRNILKGISFLSDEEIKDIDNRIAYNENMYLDYYLERIKKVFERVKEASSESLIERKIKYICEHMRNRTCINGIVDLIMYVNIIIEKLLSSEEQEKIQVSSFFVDEQDIINEDLKEILDKKSSRRRGVEIKVNDKYFIISLSPLYKEYDRNEWKGIIEKNKIFVKPKFQVGLLDYLKKNGADRNIVHNSEFLRLFSEIEKQMINDSKDYNLITGHNISIKDGMILVNWNEERILYKIEDFNLVVEDYRRNIKDTILYKDEGRNVSHQQEQIIRKQRCENRKGIIK